MSNFSIEKQFSNFGQYNYYYSKPEVKRTQKAAYLCEPTPLKISLAAAGGTALGVLGALFCIVKRHISAGKLKETDKLLSNMFKINYKSPVTLIGLGAGSVLGGLAGGMLADKKEHYAAKMKEGFHQFVGIILLPLLLAEGGLKILEHYGVREGLPEIKGKGKFINVMRRRAPAMFVSIAAIAVGMFAGNAFCNKIDEHIFEDVHRRKIKGKDWLAHADDAFDMFAFSGVEGKAERFLGIALPITYGICGYTAGTARKELEVRN